MSLKLLESQFWVKSSVQSLFPERPLALWMAMLAVGGYCDFVDRFLNAAGVCHNTAQAPEAQSWGSCYLPWCPRLLVLAYHVRQSKVSFVGLFWCPILGRFLVGDEATLPFTLITISVNQKVNAFRAV